MSMAKVHATFVYTGDLVAVVNDFVLSQGVGTLWEDDESSRFGSIHSVCLIQMTSSARLRLP